jgi:hypothetical protein
MKNTTMNTGAASLSDEQKRAAITACALMIKGICLTTPNAEWTERIENRIHYLLRQIATTPQADAAPIINGHAINDLFIKWSEWTTELGEAISRKNIDGFVSELRAAIAAGGAQEPVAWMYSSTRGVDLGRMRWSDDMKALGPADMVETPLYAAPLPRVAATVRLTDEQHKAIAVASTLCESMGYPANAKALDDILAASNGDQA